MPEVVQPPQPFPTQDTLQGETPVATQPLPQDKLDLTNYQPVFPSKPVKSTAEILYPQDSFGLVGDFWQTGTTATIIRSIDRAFYPYDPNFAITEEKLKQYTDGIPPSLWPEFQYANSEFAMRMTRANLLQSLASQDRISKAGFWSRTGIGLATGITDPVTVGLAALTGGLGEAAGLGEFATTAGRLGSITRAGVIAGLTNAEAAAITESEYGKPTAKDLFHAGAGGAILGGLTGGVFYSPRANAALMALRKSVEFQDIVDAGRKPPEVLTPKGQDYFKEQLDPAVAKAQAAELTAHEAPQPTPLDIEIGRVANMSSADLKSELVALRSMETLTPDQRAQLANDLMARYSLVNQLPEDIRNKYKEMFNATQEQGTSGVSQGTQPEGVSGVSGGNAQGGQTPVQSEVKGTGVPPSGEITGPPKSAMGAATQADTLEQVPLPEGWKPGDPDYRYVSSASGTRPLGLPRPSMIGTLLDSESQDIVRAARMTGEEVIPGKDGAPVVDSGIERAERAHAARMTSYFEEVAPVLQEWMQKNDPGFWRRASARKRFWTEVYRAGLGEDTGDPLVRKAADIGSKHYGDALDAGKRLAVPGLESIDHRGDYRHIRWSKEAIERVSANLVDGAARIEEAMTGAVLPLSDAFTPELANKIAVGMLKSISKTGEASDLVRHLALSSSDSEYMARVLRDGGVPEDVIADVQRRLAPPEPSKISPAKYRTRMNHLYEIDATDKKTGQPVKLRLTDLMDTHEPSILNQYSRQIEGAGSMQGVLRAFQKTPQDIIPNAQALAERLRLDAIAKGIPATEAASQTSKLMTLWKYMQGIPLNEPSKMGDFLLTMRKLQNAVRMGLAPFSHVNNLGGIIGETGFNELLKQAPALKELVTRDASGHLKNDLLREHIALTGSGSDRFRTEILSRLPDEDAQWELSQSKINNGLDRLSRAQADISGFAPITQGIQRIAILLNAQKWATIAKGGKGMSVARLATMGLNPADADAIIGQINKHAEYGPYGSVKAMNLSEWDPQVRANYITALDKWSRTVAQTSNISQMSQWMTKEWGKSLIQFRGYHIAAYEKQLLRGLYLKDRSLFMNWTLTSLMGMAAYVAREELSSVGRQDRAEHLDKMLSPGMLAKAAVARSGYLSLFPMAIDAGGRYTGLYSPQFSGTRSTGLENDPIFGSPTVDAISQARFLPRALIDAMRNDRKFSQEDMKVVRTMIPWQNMLGLKNALDAVQSNLTYSSGKQ